MTHIYPIKNVFRKDEVVASYDRESLLENAPEQKDGCYKVPKTVE
jgi:aspartyl-tRNA(Asn)/glutamyl-tRNA(Gln) amidotransferase subunit C